MVKRTTIEIDQDLLVRAQKALGRSTIRETVETALRLAADASDASRATRAASQLRYLSELDRHVDLDVLASDEMWR